MSEGRCTLDLSEDKSDTVFFVLGLLNEYNGRTIIEESDGIETVYCKEGHVASLFRRYVTALIAEQHLSTELGQKTVEPCLTHFSSRAVAERLNSCYLYEFTNGAWVGATGQRIGTGTLNWKLFVRPDRGAELDDPGLPGDAFYRRRALAYLAGAWARFGNESAFVFANAWDKATLIGTLLARLGCPNVRVDQNDGFIPRTTTVQFEPTAELAQWLRKRW